MKLFLHTSTRIRIISGDLEWSGTPLEFAAKEPTYPGLPTLTNYPAMVRYQTPELKYIEDSAGVRHPDLIDALSYCDNIATYLTQAPAIYVHCVMSYPVLNISDPEACIDAEISIKATNNPADPDVPISATWPINLRSKNGLVMDNILIPFESGSALIAFRYKEGLPLGEYRIDEADFDRVDLAGVSYQVKLAQPVKFTITRQLAEE
jgi:hypothetical protein